MSTSSTVLLKNKDRIFKNQFLFHIELLFKALNFRATQRSTKTYGTIKSMLPTPHTITFTTQWLE